MSNSEMARLPLLYYRGDLNSKIQILWEIQNKEGMTQLLTSQATTEILTKIYRYNVLHPSNKYI